VKKRTIVIIISFISAFVLMSGGYGLWRKPLIITGKIEVRRPPEPPKPAIGEVVQLNSEISEQPETDAINSEAPNNLETLSNSEDTASAPIDKTASTQEEKKEEAAGEAVIEENSEEPSIQDTKVEAVETGESKEDQVSETDSQANEIAETDGSEIETQNGE